jgi:hypothetical protein
MLIVLSSVIYINDFSFPEMNRKKMQKLAIGAQVQIKDDLVTCVTNYTYSIVGKSGCLKLVRGIIP